MRAAACTCLIASSLLAAPVWAQNLPLTPPTPVGAGTSAAARPSGTEWLQPSQFDLTPEPVAPWARPRVSPARTLFRDFRVAFGSRDNLRLLGGMGLLALTSARFDGVSAREAREQPVRRFTAGNIGGNMLVQSGLAVGTWGLGRMLHAPRMTAVGTDLVEAQLVTQTAVQGLKYSFRRPRPDGSNNLSFPSGHTATSFATATVLQRHFGWGAGVPAYAFASYVGIARMAADKHHLSDVIMGAGIGLVAGRSATVGVAGQRFAVGVAPAERGAAITFTRK